MAASWGPRSATSIGPPRRWDRPRRWPATLRTCLRIMLASRQPMWVWWGPELINFYNDAYLPIIGSKHPGALGQPAEEVWAEIWPQIQSAHRCRHGGRVQLFRSRAAGDAEERLSRRNLLHFFFLAGARGRWPYRRHRLRQFRRYRPGNRRAPAGAAARTGVAHLGSRYRGRCLHPVGAGAGQRSARHALRADL